MRVLVCGDREWGGVEDLQLLRATLDALHRTRGITLLIHGACPRGADQMAEDWARDNGVPFLPFPAQWHRYGKAAGPIRNREMLEHGHPSLVVAFHRDLSRSKGTRDMVEQAVTAEVEVQVYPPPRT